MDRDYHLQNNYTDKELLLLLRDERNRGFCLIYEKYHRLIYLAAYKYLKCSFMAKDAVQHVFLKFLETYTVLPETISLRNYLYTMLKNHVLNEIRNNNTALEKCYEIAQTESLCEEDLFAKIEEKDLIFLLYNYIDNLPEQKRLICLYKLKENLSNQEIAERMNLSVSTVKSHYFHALKILKTRFGAIMLIISFINSVDL